MFCQPHTLYFSQGDSDSSCNKICYESLWWSGNTAIFGEDGYLVEYIFFSENGTVHPFPGPNAQQLQIGIVTSSSCTEPSPAPSVSRTVKGNYSWWSRNLALKQLSP